MSRPVAVFDWVTQRRLFIHGLTIVAVVALLLAAWTTMRVSANQAQRERESIQADIESCQRENDLRRRVIDVGEATDELVSRILTDVDAADRFTEPLADYRSRVGSIEIVDCDEVTPGSAPERNP